MIININQVQAAVPVSVISIQGEIDASNYQDLIAIAKETHQSGARYMLIDLGEVPFLSSSGLVALHTILKMLRGEAAADADSGWDALHDIERERDKGFQPYIKLLNPQPRVDKALEKTGFKKFFPIYTDRDAALASFG